MHCHTAVFGPGGAQHGPRVFSTAGLTGVSTTAGGAVTQPATLRALISTRLQHEWFYTTAVVHSKKCSDFLPRPELAVPVCPGYSSQPVCLLYLLTRRLVKMQHTY